MNALDQYLLAAGDMRYKSCHLVVMCIHNSTSEPDEIKCQISAVTKNALSVGLDY